jgi:hypothetical protein
MSKVRRAVVLVALLGSILTTLTACGGSTEGPNQQPAQVPGAAKLDKLTIGISFDQPGLGFKDGDNYTGFDVETAKYVAKALGVPESGITWVQADPGNRESLLTSDQADLVFSTYTITEDPSGSSTSPVRTSWPTRISWSAATKPRSPGRPHWTARTCVRCRGPRLRRTCSGSTEGASSSRSSPGSPTACRP